MYCCSFVSRFPGTQFRTWVGSVAVMMCLMLLSGCASLVSSFSSSVTTSLAQNLSHTFLNSDDPATVETGGPAYLLMIDSLLMDDPDNESLLLSAAKLYTSYASAFVKEPARARRLTRKGFQYALRAVCLRDPDTCRFPEMPFDDFKTVLARMTPADLPVLYTLGSAWASALQANSTDWNAVAELPRIELIMNRVVALDEAFEDGGAHLYLGVFATLIPPALGGRPDEGKKHFERALAISGKKNLMAYVLYARYYARMMFDRELHDRLLKAVIDSDPRMEGYVLVNMVAKAEARELLAAADEYF